ncbi:MAG: gamma-glutamyltransferase [bacterium]|nr:gamma-glutamyltransferase [bacterium]
MKPMSFDFHTRRSMVLARRGMVAASNPLASQAGLAILRQGGNAADAAIAAAAVLNVTESASTGIGGDCFALYFDARTRQITALNGSGRAPAALDAALLRAQGLHEVPARSAHAVTVPGAVAGWIDLIERHGSMPLSAILADAIHYARDGFPLHPVYGAAWERSELFLRSAPHAEEYLPGGAPPAVGDVVRLPGLARTLQAIADGGKAAFYEGTVADAIVATVQRLGGVMTHADLKAHVSTWDTPITVNYRGVDVYECPPNGQGLAALQALKILENFDVQPWAWDAPERLHLQIEAMRLAFADARQYIADAAHHPAPVDFLLSARYAGERAALIGSAAMQPPSFGLPIGGSDTVYLSVVDGAGNACSFINSLYMGFGSGIVAKDTGVFLQNRGAGFTLQPGHPNELAPGKRPYHTIIPGMALKDGALWASFGVMGGFMQPQGHLQVISAMIDDDLNPQEALDRPRWMVEAMDIPPVYDAVPPEVVIALEEGIPVGTMAALAERGHRVRPVSGRGRGVFGDGQIIRRDAETGVLFGGSDPRKDGLTAGF